MDRRCMLVEKSVDGYVELRAHKAGTKPDEEDSDGEDVDEDAFDRRSGLIDIDGRIAAEVDPLAEWTQALLETWRICRDEWFDAGMAHGDARGVADWEGALIRCVRFTLVPIRPRRRGERRSLRTFPGASLRPSLGFKTRHRRLSTPPDAFQLHPDTRGCFPASRPSRSCRTCCAR